MATGHGAGKRAVDSSALVAVRALFGVEVLGGDAEHVVALDANAVDDGRARGDGRVLRLVLGFLTCRSQLVAHAGILARRRGTEARSK